jgi:malate dehydrogenase (oxaloacetate-decarboxylating)
MKAMEQGVARIKMSRDELSDRAFTIIKRARDLTQNMMKTGFIKPIPE